MNRTELVEKFFDFLERERLREERLGGGESLEEPRGLQRSVLLLLLVLCALISLFVVFFYWRKKYGVAMCDDDDVDTVATDDDDNSMIVDVNSVQLW